jgi:hypothetical protein
MPLGLQLAGGSVREMHANRQSNKPDTPHDLHERTGRAISLDHEPKDCDRRKPDKLKHWPGGSRAKQLDKEWLVRGH